MGQISKITINPIVYRLGVKKDWFFKFVNSKTSDLDNCNHIIIEIVYFINLFFKKYRLQISSLKLYYIKYSLKLFIVYSFIAYNYNNTSAFIKLKKKVLNFKGSIINDYFKHKYLTVLVSNIVNKTKSLNKYFSFNRLSIILWIYLLKFKHLNFKQLLFINLFSNKLVVIIKLFLEYKSSITIVFKQLLKNTDSKVLLYINKQQLVFNIIKLRKFDKLVYYKPSLNLVYSSLKLQDRSVILLNIISLKLSNINNLNFLGTFLKYLESLLILFLLKPGFILGFKVILTGNINKNNRATRFIITLGQYINNSKINENIAYNKSTCFTNNGTLGIKIFIKS